MKLPYRTGDSFDLPLGNGDSVGATIASCDHHVVTIAVGDVTVRAFDSALVLHRWKPCHPERSEAKSRDRPSTSLRYAQDDTSKAVAPAHAERIVAARLGVLAFDDAPLAVFEVHDEISNERLATLPPGASLSWSVPLAKGALERVRAIVALRDDLRLRLHREAATQASLFSETPVKALSLSGPWEADAPFEHVRELTLDTPSDRPLADTFPNLRTLHVTAGAKRIDLRMVESLIHLEMLDLSHVDLEDGQTLASGALPATLRALRIARVDSLRSLRGLERLGALRTLAIEHQHLDSLAPLPQCEPLEQIELLGLWQHEIGDLAWLHALPRLLRVEVDIGGRRKNLELYRGARWAYPWPEFSGVRATRVAPPK